MKEDYHCELLNRIRKQSGKPTQHTFLDTYVGNDHPRYAISSPMLRSIAKGWMKEHEDLSANELARVLTAFIHGKSGTEKVMAGILLDYAKPAQLKFDPALFDGWIEQLVGWAEVDAVCTCKYTATEITGQWKAWKTLILKFSRSENANKRRASLVLFCSPLRRYQDTRLSALALQVVDNLKDEQTILITKAISWVLRSMEKNNRAEVQQYLDAYGDTLPRIAFRETQAKLKTGVKNKRKPA